MGLWADTFRTLKPVIYTVWIVAALRLVLDATSTDPNVIAAASVYGATLVLFVHAAFAGHLDRLAWKGLFAGALMLGVLGWFVPNVIAYTTAQFQGWGHTRYYVDPEHWAIQKPLMEDEGLDYFEAKKRSEEQLGRRDETRGPPVAPTTSGKLKAALTASTFTMILSTLWCLVLLLLLVGIPSAVRRRRSSPG